MNVNGFGFYLFRCELAGTDPRDPPPVERSRNRSCLAHGLRDFGFACRAARLGVK